MKVPRSLRIVFRLACLALALGQVSFAQTAEKPRITSQDQLPRYSYPFSGKVTAVLTSDAAYAPLAEAVRKDLEKLLAGYEIADRATLREVIGTLLSLDVHAGRYESAKQRIAQLRELEEKPAAKLMAGLLAEVYMDTRRSGEHASEAAFRSAFQQAYARRIAALPWDVVADNVRAAKGSAEIATEALLLGSVEGSLQPGVDKTGTVSGDVAWSLVAQRTALAHYLPLKAERVAALSAYIAANARVKQDIWAAREASLGTGGTALPLVVMAVWDSGVDMAPFAGQRWVNTAEIPANGVDDDGNGFIDDVHGIAFNLDSQRVPEILAPLDAAQQAAYPKMRDKTKGVLDLQASIDSQESQALKRELAGLKPDQAGPFIESLNFFGNFTHGTHVAGIASAGNPAARLMAARITFDHRMIPDLPTRERSEREAQAARDTIAYFRQHGVRVVNMSWGGSPRDIEAALEANGAGGTPEERRRTAREYFQIFRQAMTEAMASAPEILFVAAAGNSDNDAAFAEFVPSGIDLPNILTVGAVDQAGEETSFTSFGPNVDVFANGFEVESFLPGGERMKYSGTSMAAPNVANLAGKLLALNPALTTDQLVSLIKLGADTLPGGRVRLIHPQRSVELLRVLQAR
jgi:subtilisin family serine protease